MNLLYNYNYNNICNDGKNNAKIINNYGSFQEHILSFKICLGARNGFFFDICGKFCHASSKRFVIPVIKRSQYGKIFCLNFYQDITLCLTCARVSFYFVCVVICAHDLMNA